MRRSLLAALLFSCVLVTSARALAVDSLAADVSLREIADGVWLHTTLSDSATGSYPAIGAPPVIWNTAPVPSKSVNSSRPLLSIAKLEGFAKPALGPASVTTLLVGTDCADHAGGGARRPPTTTEPATPL